jgi:hypothetical protein
MKELTNIDCYPSHVYEKRGMSPEGAQRLYGRPAGEAKPLPQRIVLSPGGGAAAVRPPDEQVHLRLGGGFVEQEGRTASTEPFTPPVGLTLRRPPRALHPAAASLREQQGAMGRTG